MKTLPLLWCALIGPVAMPAHAQTAPPAPLPTPLAGEIALEGRIESLDVVKNTLVLRATSFSTSSGASKPLPQPKTKAIQIGDATQFLKRNGLKNLSLGDLEKGLSIRVVGREVAGKPFAARLIAWDAPALIELDPLTPREKAPFLPPPQTQNGITLRIIDAGWMSLAQMWPHEVSVRPVFTFAYTLPGVYDGQPNEQGWATSVAERNTRLLQISGPNGEPVRIINGGALQRDGGAHGGTRVACGGVNPAWKHIIAEFETLDPDAPRDASGAFKSTLKFDQVPLPAKTGEETMVGKEMTTEHGAKITLESVRAGKGEGYEKGRTFFKFALAPPSTVRDLKVELDLESVRDENDVLWQYNGWGSGFNEVNVVATPPEGSKSLTLAIKINESAASLKKTSWYRRFRVEMPVAGLLKLMAPVGASAPPAKVEGKAFTLEIEHETSKNIGNWHAMAWLTPRDGADTTQRWLLREVVARAQDKETRGSAYELDYDREFMRLTGVPAAPGEHSQRFLVPFRTAWPEKFDLEFKVEKARRLESFSWLRGVPLPAPSASLDIPEGRFENDNLRVKRLFWFKDASELTGLSAEWRDNIESANLAVVVELFPLFPGAAMQAPLFRAGDDAGRRLQEGQWLLPGDAGRVGTQNTNLRTLLLAVPASSKNLHLWFHLIENSWSGQTETLVLKDVAGK